MTRTRRRTRKELLLRAAKDVLQEAETLEAWLEDTSYPRRSWDNWREVLDHLKALVEKDAP